MTMKLNSGLKNISMSMTMRFFHHIVLNCTCLLEDGHSSVLLKIEIMMIVREITFRLFWTLVRIANE